MKVAIFGGTDRAGRQLIRQCIDQGHHVRALVRNPESLRASGSGLEIVGGDVLEPGIVAAVVAGCDCVFSALGAQGLGETTLYSDSMKVLVEAMREHQVRRLLCVSAVGVDLVSNVKIPLLRKATARLFLRRVFADMRRMQRIVESTDLEWTIMWPPVLTNGGLTAKYRIAFGDAVVRGTRISRADLAHCMVTGIGRSDFLNEKVAIAY